MKLILKTFSGELELSDDCQQILLQSHTLENQSVYQAALLKNKEVSSIKNSRQGTDIFGFGAEPPKIKPIPDPIEKTKTVIWATDNYNGENHGFTDKIIKKSLGVIKPRAEKTKEDQKRRVKEKAEVFTPSWVCNLQNNLIDDEVVGKGAFNRVSEDQKIWTPSKSPVKFKDPKYTWMHYVIERRLEACCGEGPYLFSPYDTVTGNIIPVRDTKKRFQRIGLLDRKLRVVTENVSPEDWFDAAIVALKATFGYEWQGDNLILARLNAVSTFVDYYEDFLGENLITKCHLNEKQLREVCEIVSWNLWQMDGLKQVVPESCTIACGACKNKKRAGHDGSHPIIRFQNGEGYSVFPFEKMLPIEMFFNKPSREIY